MELMNGKAPETDKHKFHWLNVWLDLQIVVFFYYLFLDLHPLPLHPDLPGFPIPALSYTIFSSAYDIALIVCCVFIQLWRKWAVYGYFVLNVAYTLSWAWMLRTWPGAPAFVFLFVLLLVTWLLIRPFWEQFK